VWTGAAERLRKWVGRRPAVAGLLAAILLLVRVGGAGTWLLSQQWAAAVAVGQQRVEAVGG
jgi:hypothetical protein